MIQTAYLASFDSWLQVLLILFESVSICGWAGSYFSNHDFVLTPNGSSQQAFTANYKNQKIRITTNGGPEVDYGDYVRISGKISNQNNGLLMYFRR